MHRLHRMPTIRAGAQIRARNALIRIRRLLHRHFLMRRLAAAAAHASEPEELRCNGEGDGKPDNGQHFCAERGVDVHRFEDRVEGRGESAVDGG